MPGCCAKTLHTLILVTASTLYLLLGLGVVVASASTFFSKWGQILTPLYAASSLGGGLVIFFVSMIGFKAACGREKCWLGTFMLFDILLLVLAIVTSALMFEYEHVLNIAADSKLDNELTTGIETLSQVQTDVVSTLVDNAWDACNGNTTAIAGVFTFACGRHEFSFFGSNVNSCLANGVNATAGSTFDECYSSPKWVELPDLINAPNSNLLTVLNQPKGLFCACSATIIDKFLTYFRYTKYIAICICVFFVLVFVSCCYLCCCTKPVGDESQHAELTPIGGGRGWSVGSSASAPIQTKSKKGSRGTPRHQAYLARP